MGSPSLPNIDQSPAAFDTAWTDQLVTPKNNYDAAGNLVGALPTSLIVQHPTAEYGNTVDDLIRVFQRRLWHPADLAAIEALGTDDGITVGDIVTVADGATYVCATAAAATSTWTAAASSETLAATLVLGNATGGTSIAVTAADQIQHLDNQGTPVARAREDYNTAGSSWRKRFYSAAGALLTTMAVSCTTGALTYDGAVDLTQGAQLQSASTLRSGSGAPSAGVGVNGDYYFRSNAVGIDDGIYVKVSGSWLPFTMPAAGTTVSATLRWTGTAWVEDTNFRSTGGFGVATYGSGSGETSYAVYHAGKLHAEFGLGANEDIYMRWRNGLAAPEATYTYTTTGKEWRWKYDSGVASGTIAVLDLDAETFRVGKATAGLTPLVIVNTNTAQSGGYEWRVGGTTQWSALVDASDNWALAKAGAVAVMTANQATSLVTFAADVTLSHQNAILTIGNGLGAPVVIHNKVGSAAVGVQFQSDSVQRWQLQHTAADDLTIRLYNGGGVYQYDALAISQSTGNVSINSALFVAGAGSVFGASSAAFSGSALNVQGTVALYSSGADVASKEARIVARPYTNAHGSFQVIHAFADTSNNLVGFGGLLGGDAPTEMRFYTASALDTGGTLRGTITSAGLLNWTGDVTLSGANPVLAVGQAAGNADIGLFKAASGVARIIYRGPGGLADWEAKSDSSENYIISRYIAGVFQDNALLISNATGNVTLAQSLFVTGTGSVFGASSAAFSGNALNVHGLNGRVVISDNTTDAAQKDARIGTGHYLNAEEPFFALKATSTASDNLADIGGGTSVGNAATQIRFYQAPGATTIIGTLAGSINGSQKWTIGASGGSQVHDVNGGIELTGNITLDSANPALWLDANSNGSATIDLTEAGTANTNGFRVRFDGANNETVMGGLSSGGAFQEVLAFARDSQALGAFGAAPAAKQTVTGSRGGNAALASLLTALATFGFITDSSAA